MSAAKEEEMTGLKFGSIGLLALAAALVLLPSAAPAYWSAYLYDGTKYGIREGNTYIPLDATEKEANRTAKKINKALAKDKEDSGFVDTGEGPCGDPKSGVLC
jgi:hypothetical protein